MKMSSKNFVYVDTIEQIVVNSRKERNYIRCKNTLDFLKWVEKDNPIIKEYERKLSRINMATEYKKRAAQNSSRIDPTTLLIEIFSLYMTYEFSMYMMWKLELEIFYTVLMWIVFYTFFRIFVRWFYMKLTGLFT